MEFSSLDVGIDKVVEPSTVYPPTLEESPLQRAISFRTKNPGAVRVSGCPSKFEKSLFRMNKYINPMTIVPLGGYTIIYEPPLVDCCKNVGVIEFCCLALEHYNQREGTNYNYVGLIKAYAWSTASIRFKLFFSAAEALDSDFDDVPFRANVYLKRLDDGTGKLTTIIEHVSKCPELSNRWPVMYPMLT